MPGKLSTAVLANSFVMTIRNDRLVTIGIHLLPFPEIGAHFLNASGCLPVQLFFGQRSDDLKKIFI